MAWSAKLNGYEQLAPELQATARAGLLQGMENLGVEGARFVQDNITTPYNGLPPAVFTGNLAHSIAAQVIPDQALIRLIVGVTPSLGAGVYAPPVETGARPHMPSAMALIPWVMKKFGIADEKHALSAAYAVSQSMAKKGTKGHFMFSRALDQLEPVAPSILEAAIAQAFMRAGFGGESGAH